MTQDKFSIIISQAGEISYIDSNKDQLAPFEGKWNLGPSTSNMLIFERDKESRNEMSTLSSILGQVLFSGLIQEGTLLEFFNFIGENNRSGVLVAIHNNTKKSLFFKDGALKYATSNSKHDLLGHVLYRYGIVEKNDIAKALKESPSQRLGETLIKMKLLTVPELYKAIKLQIQDIVFSIFNFKNGFFYFYEVINDSLFPSNLNFSTHNLLMEAVRRMDEMTYFKKQLPNENVVPHITSTATIDNLTANESTVYKLIDSSRTLKEIARLSKLGIYETTRTLFYLIKGGYVKIKTMSSMTNDLPVCKENLHRLISTYNKLFKYISEHSKISDQLHKGFLSFIDNLSPELNKVFSGTIAGDLQIELKKIVVNIEKIDDNSKLLGKIYKTLDEMYYFLLFSSGVNVPKDLENEISEVMASLKNK